MNDDQEARALLDSVPHYSTCILGMSEWDQAAFTETEKTCNCDRDLRAVSTALSRSREAREQAIEEAAREVERRKPVWTYQTQPSCNELAASIRALSATTLDGKQLPDEDNFMGTNQ